MTGEWFTYREAAELLNASPEAVRQRAVRGRWQRTLGNDKLTRVRLPEGWEHAVPASYNRPSKPRVRIVDERVPAKRMIEVLEALVETLKAQLAAAADRADKEAAEFAARTARHAADLDAERTLATQLSARVDRLTVDLALSNAERAKAEKELAAELGRARWMLWLRRLTG